MLRYVEIKNCFGHSGPHWVIFEYKFTIPRPAVPHQRRTAISEPCMRSYSTTAPLMRRTRISKQRYENQKRNEEATQSEARCITKAEIRAGCAKESSASTTATASVPTRSHLALHVTSSANSQCGHPQHPKRSTSPLICSNQTVNINLMPFRNTFFTRRQEHQKQAGELYPCVVIILR